MPRLALAPQASHTDDRAVRRPPRPREDPFYDAPERLALLAPGTLIRTRQVRLGLLGVVPQKNLEAWQLAYRSTDLHGAAEVAVTTVVVPHGHDPAAAHRLIAYQCAIDAVSDRCFPSYALRPGTRAWGCLPQFELMIIATLVERGYVVSICDHEGRRGSFAAPREPGHRILDGVRALRNFAPVGTDHTTPVGLLGYSGGGLASSWAAEMAASYAPEVPLVGAVLGSPVADPGEAFIKLNGGLHAGLPALVVSGLREIYPGLARIIRKHASLDGIRRLDALRELSTMSAVIQYAFDEFDDFLDAPLADVLATPEVLAVFEDLRLGKTAPQIPLLVVQAVHDQIIDHRDIDSQVRQYADGGTEITYVKDHLSEHISLMILGLPVMLNWLERRFRGIEPTSGTHAVRSLALSPRAWPDYVRMLGAAARTVVGRAG